MFDGSVPVIKMTYCSLFMLGHQLFRSTTEWHSRNDRSWCCAHAHKLTTFGCNTCKLLTTAAATAFILLLFLCTKLQRFQAKFYASLRMDKCIQFYSNCNRMSVLNLFQFEWLNLKSFFFLIFTRAHINGVHGSIRLLQKNVNLVF